MIIYRREKKIAKDDFIFYMQIDIQCINLKDLKRITRTSDRN